MNTGLLTFMTRYMWSYNHTFLQELNAIQWQYFNDGCISILSDETTIQESLLFERIVREISSNVTVLVFECLKSVTIDTYLYFHKPRYGILYMDEALKGDCIEHLRDSAIWNAKGKNLVLVEGKHLAQPWLSAMWDRTRAIDVTIIDISKREKYWTWYPYRNECSNVVSVVDVMKENLFPFKVEKNINGCPLQALQAEIFPYNVPPNGGVETLILRTISQQINASLNVSVLQSQDFYKTISLEGKPEGSLQLIYEQMADIAAGGLQQRFEYGRFAEIVIFHTEDHLGWFVPKPALIPNVEKLQRAIPSYFWVWIVCIFIFVSIQTVILNYISNLSPLTVAECISRTITAYLFLPTKIPSKFSIQVLFLFLFSFSIHITTLYQSALIYILSNKVTEAPITSVQEAIDRNLRFHFYEIHRNLVNVSDNKYWVQLEKRNQYSIAFFVPYGKFARERSGVFLGPVAPNSFYMERAELLDEDGHILFSCLNEKFYATHTVFIMAPAHPLFPFVWDITQRLLEGGFPPFWLKLYMGKEAGMPLRQNLPISLESISGAFQLISIVLTVSMFILLCELVGNFIKTCGKRKKCKYRRSHP